MTPYSIHLLVTKHHDTYPGEHAPEVLDAIDEFTLDSNPDAWDDAVKKAKATYGDDMPLGHLIVTIDQAAVDHALDPTVAILGTTKVVTSKENPDAR